MFPPQLPQYAEGRFKLKVRNQTIDYHSMKAFTRGVQNHHNLKSYKVWHFVLLHTPGLVKISLLKIIP